MSTGKIDDLVSDAALERLDTLLTKLGITRDAMASATEQAAKLNSALGDTKSMQEFQAAQEKATAATQTVISANNTIISQQKEIATQTQAAVEVTKAKLLADTETGKVLTQINGTTEANIKLLIEQKIQLQAVNDALKLHTKEITSSSASQAAHAQKTVELTKRQVELKESTGQLSLLIKQQTKEQLAAITSNDAQLARLNQLRKAYNSLSEEEVKNIAVGGALLTEIEALAAATSTANEKQGKFNDSVGKYQNAGASLGKSIGGMLGPLRQLAYILPGIGLAGLFNLAFEGIQKALSGLDLFKGKVEALGGLLKNFNEVNKETASQYGEQSTRLKILYGAATDVNNSMHDRLLATLELKKEFPNTFENLKNEAILNGEATKSFKELTASILEQAMAKASLSKIEKLAAVQTEAEIQKQKINTARNNELSRAKDGSDDEQSAANRSGGGAVRAVDKRAVINRRNDEKITEQNQLIKDAQDQINFFTKLGGGNNKMALELSKGNAKKLSDQTKKDAKELNNDELELLKAKLVGEKETAKLILDDNLQSYEARYAALKIFVDRSKEIIGVEHTVADRAPGISSTKKKVNAQNASNQNATVDNFDLTERIKIQKEINEHVKSEQKKLLDSYVANEKAKEDLITNGYNQELLELDLTNSDKILKITDAYSKGLISEKNYNNQVNKLRKDATAEGIDIQIKALEKIAEAQAAGLALGYGNPKDLQATGNKITGLKIQSNNLKTGSLADGVKGDKLTSKEKAQEILAFADQAIKGLEIVQGLIDANAKAKIDALEREYGLIQQNGEAEKSRVDNSILSSKEKARQNSIIDAQVAQQRARITQQENEIKKKQAEFDKAASIAKIIQQTAIAVVTALTIPIFGIALAGIIGALGAAQLAVAIATPLPQFEKGGTVKKDGPIITGEAGTELRIDPSGRTSFTSDHANVTYAKAGTKIINNKDLVKMLGKPEQVQYIVNATNDNKKVEKLLEQNNELQRRSKRPVVNVFNDKFGGTYAKRNY